MSALGEHKVGAAGSGQDAVYGEVGDLLQVAASSYSPPHLASGWAAVLRGVLLPRLLLYPQLAWLSLFVEHTWFDPDPDPDPDPRTGARAWVVAGRCLRLYPPNRLLTALAATTWLPYGDLHHDAHSAHPAVRWNYLPAVERHLSTPHFTPPALLLGPASVARRHLHALSASAAVEPRLSRVGDWRGG
ncbi:hypothetical protein [Streptomyces sp. NPDC000888]